MNENNPFELEEVVYKIDDFFLFVQQVDDGYDYTIYDKNLIALDGGVYDDLSISMKESIDEIVEGFEFLKAYDFEVSPQIDPYWFRKKVEIVEENIVKQQKTLAEFASFLKHNSECVVQKVSNDLEFHNNLQLVLHISDLSYNLDSKYSFSQLSNLHHYCKDIWLKYEDFTLAEVSDFACMAINENFVTIENIQNFSRKEFFNALCNEDPTILKKESLSISNALNNITYESVPGVSNLVFDKIKTDFFIKYMLLFDDNAETSICAVQDLMDSFVNDAKMGLDITKYCNVDMDYNARRDIRDGLLSKLDTQELIEDELEI